jgi:excisionase family DNA binding protein
MESTKSPDGTDGYFTAGEVAELFGVDPRTVTRWALLGRIPFERTLGGHRRYPKEKIRKLKGTPQ